MSNKFDEFLGHVIDVKTTQGKCASIYIGMPFDAQMDSTGWWDIGADTYDDALTAIQIVFGDDTTIDSIDGWRTLEEARSHNFHVDEESRVDL